MSQQQEGPADFKTLIAGGTISRGCMVKVSGTGVILTAAETDQPIGVAQEDAVSGNPVNVKLWNRGGTVKIKVGAAISVGAAVYSPATATGLGAASGTTVRATALEASTASGDFIECLPLL